MKKIPPKTLKRLNDLKSQMRELTEQEHKEVANLLFQLACTNIDPCDKKEQIAEIHYKYDRQYEIVRAKWAALFLIATNIARRGKPLQPDNAKKKLQKHGEDGSKIIAVLDTPVCPMVLNSEPFLASELYYKYGVTLMDRYLADHVKQKILYYSRIPWQQAQANHYKSFLKKFHKSVLESKFDQREYEPF